MPGDKQNHHEEVTNSKEEQIKRLAEKAAIDAEQREMQLEQKKMQEDLEDVRKDVWDKAKQKADEVFDRSNTAHQLVLNAEVLAGLGKSLEGQSAKLSKNLNRLTMKLLTTSLSSLFPDSKSEKNNVDYEKLGKEVCVFFKSVPMNDTMLGPIQFEVAAKKKAEKRQRVEKPVYEEEQPEILVKKAKKDNEAEDGAESGFTQHKKLQQELVVLLEQTALRHTKTDDGKTVYALEDLAPYVVNPKSFAQTVENFFALSFLIRDRFIQVVDSPNSDWLQMKYDGSREKNSRDTIQSILNLDIPTWEAMCKALNIKKSKMAHREGSFYEEGGK